MSSNNYHVTFGYRALDFPDSIRVLELQSKVTSPSGEIKCRVLHKRLLEYEEDLVEHYVALSYVWGSPDNPKNISVDGFQFPVTRNLYHALQDLQEEIRPICLWVDAICINQSDILERGQQVSLMGSIYTLAHHTVIYLGKAQAEIDGAFKKLVSRNRLHKWKMVIKGHSEQEPVMQTMREPLPLIPAALLEVPWFTRVWIFQELILSRDPWVQYGKNRLSWTSFFKIFQLYNQNHSSSSAIVQHFGQAENSEAANSSRLFSLNEARLKYQKDLLHGTSHFSLIDILISRRGAQATDARDTIFGYMGIASLPNPPFMNQDFPPPTLLTKPNYSKSASQVFNDFACDIIQWSGGFGIFSYVEDIDPSLRRANLASWTPDWTKYGLRSPRPISTRPITALHDKIGAIPTKQNIFLCRPESSLLVTLGSNPDAIVEVSKPIPWTPSELIDLGSYAPGFGPDASFDPDTLRKAKTRYAQGGIASALKGAGSIFNDPTKCSEPNEDYCTMYRSIYNLYASALGHQFLPALDENIHPSRENINAVRERYAVGVHSTSEEIRLDLSDLFFLHTYADHDRSILSGRRLASFKSGRVGVVPDASEVGDVMYMFGDTPNIHEKTSFIFRRVSEDGTSKVGDLNGEIMDGLEKCGVENGWKDRLGGDVENVRLVGECCVQQTQLKSFLRQRMRDIKLRRGKKEVRDVAALDILIIS